MITKHWQITKPIDEQIKAKFPELDPILLQLLWNRGLKTQAEIDEFLNPDWSQDVHDPYLFQQMILAVERIYEAIGSGEIIGVYGDYDADGVSAAVIIFSTLKKLGAKVEVYLPHREREGYGLNEEAIRYLKEKKVKLIITCDCGVANVKQVAYANSLGLKVIITDHHQAQSALPAASAILHPSLPGETYPFKFLSGGGVAFKLVQGLLRYEGCPLPEREREIQEKWLLDLVAISTVADMVPLLGENRTLVNYGLTVLRKGRRLGLAKLLLTAGVKLSDLDTYTIGWQIAPRLNAAGRMDHANAAYALLMSDNPRQATELAQALNLANNERQQITEQMVIASRAQVGTLKARDFFVHSFDPSWPVGVVGLVAGRLSQEYYRPALVMTQLGERIAGSGRSPIESFNLSQALADCGQYLISYGGHKSAAGFSLVKDKLEAFLKAFTQVVTQALAEKDLSPRLNLDLVISLPQVDWPIQESVAKLEPVGQANPSARFATLGAKVTELTPVGAWGQHLRLTLEQHSVKRRFIWFRQAESGLQLKPDDLIDVAYEIGVNEWNGNRDLELKAIDIKLSKKEP